MAISSSRPPASWNCLAATLAKCSRRESPAQVGPSEGPGVFSVVDGGALDPAAAAERGLPVLLVANGAADAPGYAAAGCDVLGIIARSHDVPGEHVLGVYPPIPGPGPDDPLWLAKAADMLESHVDLWPLLRIAQPG